MKKSMSRCLLAFVATEICFALPARAITIDPTFDSSITTSANASIWESTINNAISNIDSTLGGTNITVSIYFSNNCIPITGTTSNCLGNNLSTFTSTYGPSYTQYTNALKADATANSGNTVLNTAVNHLSSGNTGGYIVTTEANMAALGLSCASCVWQTIGGTNYDGQAGINFSGIASGGYTAQGTVEHEIDEILGIGGLGSVLGFTDAGALSYNNTTYIGDMDLYRYACGGSTVASLSASASCADFSVDGGVTDIMGFNQTSGGDYADWANTIGGVGAAGCNANVQGAWACPGGAGAATLGTAEIDALEAIGYNLGGSSGTGNNNGTGVPEPDISVLSGLALLTALFAVRRPRIRTR